MSLMLRGTALHEAGHALLATSLGVPVAVATVEPTAWSRGHVEWGKGWRADAPSPPLFDPNDNFPAILVYGVLIDLAITAAGPCAEALLFDAQQEWRPNNDVDQEENAAIALCEAVGAPLGWAGYVRTVVRDCVQAYLRSHTAALEVLAEALIAHRTLNGEQVDALLLDHDLPAVDLAKATELARGLFRRHRRARRETVTT